MAKAPRTARNKMMDLLALRDHSEKEMRKKLLQKFTPEEVETAITYGRENGWLPNSEAEEMKLAGKAADTLHRKKKGIRYINSKLLEMGLPEVESNSDVELEKALNLVKNKYQSNSDKTFAERQKWRGKVGRFLISRGFETEIAKAVISELEKNRNRDGDSNEDE